MIDNTAAALGIILGLLILSAARGADAAVLTIQTPGKGGSVTTDDGEIYCKQRTCRANIRSRYVVLHTNPWAGWEISRWSGACRGRAPICRLDIRSPKTVRVTWKKSTVNEPPVSAYTHDGKLLGRVIGKGNGRYESITILTAKGKTLELLHRSGHPLRIHSQNLYFTRLGCLGEAYSEATPERVVFTDVGPDSTPANAPHIEVFYAHGAPVSIRVHSSWDIRNKFGCQDFGGDGTGWAATLRPAIVNDLSDVIDAMPVIGEAIGIR